jgi:hypothetical protein
MTRGTVPNDDLDVTASGYAIGVNASNEREPRHGTPRTIDLLCGIGERKRVRTVYPAGTLEL